MIRELVRDLLEESPGEALSALCSLGKTKQGKAEIVKELGVISEGARGWSKELNLISWNDNAPKYDIRDWAPDHSRMGKGTSLTEEEMEKLVELFNSRDEEDSFE